MIGEFTAVKLADGESVVMKLLSGPVDRACVFKDRPYLRTTFLVEEGGQTKIFSCGRSVEKMMEQQGIAVGIYFGVTRYDGHRAIDRVYAVFKVPPPPVPPAWWKANGGQSHLSARSRKPEKYWTHVDWMRDRLEGLTRYRDLTRGQITDRTRREIVRILSQLRYEERLGTGGATPAVKRILRRILRGG